VLERGLRRHPGSAALARAARVVEGEVAVLAGRWSPPGHAPEGDFSAVAATVLHCVGMTLPHDHSGFAVRTHAVARSQAGAGLRPVVVSRLGFPWSLGVEPASRVEGLDGVAYHRIGDGETPRRWDDRLTAAYEALLPIVEDVRPGVIHAHSDFQNALLGAALSDRYELPFVYEVRGFWEETWLVAAPGRTVDTEGYRWRREREIESMRRADRVVTLSGIMRDRIVADGVDPAKVTIVPNAVDPAAFPIPGGRSRGLAARLGIAPDAFVAGYVTGLKAYEGIDTLIEAIGEMRRLGRDVVGLIVGDGPEAAALRDLATALGLADVVRFTGSVPHDEIAAYYGMLDVFVVPRRDDSVCRLVTPLKPFEALATGTPLVVSAVPPLTEIVDESGAGLTFSPGDASGLAEAMARLHDDPDLRAEMGASGAAWVRANRTWERNGETYREMYRDLGLPGIA
jgi:glycosyltransferase involved in cell wall biosynthesis